jgi:hypothetical protein
MHSIKNELSGKHAQFFGTGRNCIKKIHSFKTHSDKMYRIKELSEKMLTLKKKCSFKELSE